MYSWTLLSLHDKDISKNLVGRFTEKVVSSKGTSVILRYSREVIGQEESGLLNILLVDFLCYSLGIGLPNDAYQYLWFVFIIILLCVLRHSLDVGSVMLR